MHKVALIAVLILLAGTVGYGGAPSSVDSGGQVDPASLDEIKLNGSYGTLGFKGAVERSLEKSGWKYTVKDLSLRYIASGRINITNEIRVRIGLVATQRPRSANGYWKQLFEQTQATDHILSAAAPEATVTGLAFTIPKEAVEQATLVGLFVSDGKLVWSISDKLKPEPVGLAKGGGRDRAGKNQPSSAPAGGSGDRSAKSNQNEADKTGDARASKNGEPSGEKEAGAPSRSSDTSRPEPALKVGSKAPNLQTGKWIQGDPVKEFENGKAYIVEFWATWCGPCRVSIPHLNDIYARHKDKGLVVIGQDCWEQDEGEVPPFVKRMGEKMTYRVALDDKNGSEKGKMAETWMEAAGRNGIPSAFLVGTNGVIAWIGHPMELTDKMIDDVLEGRFDAAKAAVEGEAQKDSEQKLLAIIGELSRALQANDWTTVSEKIDEAEKLMPEAQRGQLEMVRFNLLTAQKKFSEAYKLAASLSEAHKDNVALQNELAWTIATDKSLTERDLGLAEKCAIRANDAALGKEPAVLDTLARVLFMRGKKDEAIKAQEKAVALADGDLKEGLQKTLESYRKGELPKE